MIPASNALDLHLAGEVVDAVRDGLFNVWAVDTIEDGIELLTGVEAGEWADEVGWSEGSVFGRCEATARRNGGLMRHCGQGYPKNVDSGEDDHTVEGSDDDNARR